MTRTFGAPADEKDRTMPRQSTLDGFADELSACEGVSLLDLEPSTTLLVRTRHSVYRIIVVQDTTILVQGGPSFPDVTVGHLNGSGFGGNLLKLSWIGVGLRMEISSNGRRFVTSPVRTITTECDPSSNWHERATLYSSAVTRQRTAMNSPLSSIQPASTTPR